MMDFKWFLGDRGKQTVTPELAETKGKGGEKTSGCIQEELSPASGDFPSSESESTPAE